LKHSDFGFDRSGSDYQVPQPIPTFRLSEKCEHIMPIMSYVAVVAMLVLVMLPVLVPAVISAAHRIIGSNRPARTRGYLRPAAA
jgi:hypothetical protein